MNKKLLVLMLFVILIVTTACKTEEKVEAPSPEKETKEVVKTVETEVEEPEVIEKKRIVGPLKEMIAPDFTLEDIDGNEVTLSELQGNVVLLTFWTSW